MEGRVEMNIETIMAVQRHVNDVTLSMSGAQAVKPPSVRAVILKIRVPNAFDPEAFCDQISQSLGRKGYVSLDVYLSRSRRHVKIGWS
jgi:hypothetical protein